MDDLDSLLDFEAGLFEEEENGKSIKSIKCQQFKFYIHLLTFSAYQLFL